METLQRTANRGSISTGYDIDNSLKTEADNSEYLSRVLSTTGNRRTFTISTWRKRTELGDMQTMYSCNVSGQEGTLLRFATENANYPDAIQIDIGAVGTNSRSYTAASFRDTSAWYHVVLAVDTTQSTATDRFKLYVNGVLITDYASRNNPAQNFDTSNNHADNGNTQHVGAYTTGGQVYGKTSGYTADTYHIDGQALAPTEFGEFDEDTGIWKPKAYTGSYGTNGFFLDFSDSANLGDDVSGNSNNFTENNITSADQAVDTPTNNFATLNPLHATSYYTLKEGGTVLEPSQSGWGTGVSSIGVTSGKWYFEERSTATDRTTIYGVVNESDVLDLQGDKHVGDGVYSVGFYGNSAQVFSNGSVIATYNTFNQNQLVACALDLDNGKVYFAIQNTWQNSADPANGTGGISLPTGGSDTYFFGVNGYFSDNDVKTNHGGYTIQTPDSAASDANGYGTFEYAPPSGYYALCTKNLAEYG